MKRRLVIALSILLLLTAPARLVAKGKTVKIVVHGTDLAKPIEISDPNVLANFRVWTGPGTSSNEAQGLIVDWSSGAVKQLPERLLRYQVSFYVGEANERLAYVVSYAFDPSTAHGYVYIPGRSDKGFELNVRSIFRGVEGNWYHAWTVWEDIAVPLITKARVPNSATPLENQKDAPRLVET
jgi:hypothetical protein